MLNTKKVEVLRKKMDVTQVYVAEKLGMTKGTYINLIKNGDFRAKQLIILAELLAVPLGYLFDEVDENGNKTGTDKVKEPRSAYGLKTELKERINELKGHLIDKDKLLKMLESNNEEHIEKIRSFLIRQDWCISNCEDCEGLTFKV